MEKQPVKGGNDPGVVDPALLQAHISKVDAKFKALQPKRAAKIKEMRKVSVEGVGKGAKGSKRSNENIKVRRRRDLPKTCSTAYQLCKHMLRKRTCKAGNSCIFAHSVKELNKWNKELGQEIDNTVIPTAIFARHVPRYKPPIMEPGCQYRLCRHARGPKRNCKMGADCHFAHSREELEIWNSKKYDNDEDPTGMGSYSPAGNVPYYYNGMGHVPVMQPMMVQNGGVPNQSMQLMPQMYPYENTCVYFVPHYIPLYIDPSTGKFKDAGLDISSYTTNAENCVEDHEIHEVIQEKEQSEAVEVAAARKDGETG